MARNGCEFMEELARRQHAFWLGMLCWWIGAVVLVSIVSGYVSKTPALLMQTVVYGSFLIAFFTLARRVQRVQCPHCHRGAGAMPIWRYKFLFCKACGERIECQQLAKASSA
jgi:small-conductance mechanosensitive channel